MFGDSFVKIFKFLRILYSFYKSFNDFKVKIIILWNLGKSFLEKMEIGKHIFGKIHEKLAHF
jgi:hypothetical protein